MSAPRFKVNNPSLQNVFDKITDYLNYLDRKQKKIIAGENIRKDETADEIIIHGTPAGAGGDGVAVADCKCPFEVTFEQVEDSDPVVFKGIVDYGHINGRLVERTEFATDIDPEDDEAKFLVADVTFGGHGEYANSTFEELDDLPDQPEPEEDYVTNAQIVIGIRQGVAFNRIIGCGNILIYQTPLFSENNKYFTYEMVVV